MIAGLPEPLFLMGRGGGGGGFSGPTFFAPLSSSLAPTTGSASPAFTRATTKDYLNSLGLVAQVGSGVAAFNYNAAGGTPGVSIEGTATNLLLQSQDATNAAWTASSLTVAGGVSDPDSGTNAQTLTATGANATLLQSLVLASAARVFSVWLRRRTGVGVVSVSPDGTAFTAVALTASWQRFYAANTAANPSPGLRLAASGDAVDFSFSQFEPGTVPSSYIFTTTGAVSRAADSPSYSSPLTGMSAVTISEWVRTPWSGAQAASNSGWFLGIGSSGHGDIRVRNNNATFGLNVFDGGSTQYASGSLVMNGVNWTANTWHNIVIQLTLTGLANMYVDGVLLVGSGQLAGWVNLSAMSSQPIFPGSLTGGSQANGDYRNLSVYPRILSAGDVAAVYAAGVH